MATGLEDGGGETGKSMTETSAWSLAGSTMDDDEGTSQTSSCSVGQDSQEDDTLSQRQSDASTKGSIHSKRSSAATSPQQQSFLSRFVSSFRSSSSERPSLSRSTSSPLVKQPSASPRSPVRQATNFASSGSRVKTSPSNISLSSLRPSFRRSSTAGALQLDSSSPTAVDVVPSSTSTSSTAPLTKETDEILDRRAKEIREPIVGRQKRGSVTSQHTVLPPSSNSQPSHHFASSSTSSPPPLLESPLALINTLLPPALLLLAQLGPAHLFSPPLQSPSSGSSSARPGESTSADSHSPAPFFDHYSPAETSRSTSTSYHRTGTGSPVYARELYAPSTISVPAVSAAALWRLLRGIEWISEIGGEAGERMKDYDAGDDENVFDFPALLQGVADVLAAEAATREVELVIGQIGRGALPSPVSTPPVNEVRNSKVKGKGREEESRELWVRGDERGWVVALLWILHSIIVEAPPGSTVDARFIALSSAAPEVKSTVVDSQETTVPTRDSLQKWWTVSVEFLLTTPSRSPSPDETPGVRQSSLPLALPSFDSPTSRSLFSLLDLSMTTLSIVKGPTSDNFAWNLAATLPAPRPVVSGLDESASVFERRKASLETPGTEPRIDELLAFVESALKGMKVELRAGERSTFAKHLTVYLAGWGMDVTHVSLDVPELGSNSSSNSPAATSVTGAGEMMWNHGRREVLGRYDSGFGGTGASASTAGDSTSPLSDRPLPAESTGSGLHSRVTSNPDMMTSSNSSSAGDPTSSTAVGNLIIIDDDISTLKRLLQAHRQPPPLSYAPTLLKQRPQLSTRRTRSSTHVRPTLPAIPSPSIIILFASLTHYKQIKDIVRDAIGSTRSTNLPEVLVIPKPAGPRRIITALWTALRRPSVDPSLTPIATSPAAPGVLYWTPRLSPALSSQQDFESVAAESVSNKSDSGASGSAPRIRTPPCYFPGSVAGHPPSPLGKISDEQVSYFSCVAETMDGTSPSEGMVIQSPDGRPAIFFQPQPRNARVTSGRSGKLCDDLLEAPEEEVIEGVKTPPATPPISRGAVSAPHEIGLGHGRRSSSSSASEIIAAGTPALTLDMYITAAKSRAQSDTSSPEGSKAPNSPPPNIGLHRQGSNATRPPLPTSASARPALGPLFSPRVRNASGPLPSTGPPRVESPVFSNNNGRSSPVVGIVSPVRRFSGASGLGRTRRNTLRRSPVPSTVPPINVLIVEDNPINQTILSMFMKKKGIKFAVANNGEEAVQKWKAGNFHLVLMDIQLPVKDGIEATREIRAMERDNNVRACGLDGDGSTSPLISSTSSSSSSPTSPLLIMPVIIVALTASSLQVDRVNALAAGCNDFLTKPVSLPWLQQKLLQWGSMSYLSGFSRLPISPLNISSNDLGPSLESAAFKSGMAVGNAKSDSMALRIPPQSLAPTLMIHSPSPEVTPVVATPQVPVGAAPALVTPAQDAVSIDLEKVDEALLKRPGPQPILGDIVAEGERLVRVNTRSRGSSISSSFSQVMHESGTVSLIPSPEL